MKEINFLKLDFVKFQMIFNLNATSRCICTTVLVLFFFKGYHLEIGTFLILSIHCIQNWIDLEYNQYYVYILGYSSKLCGYHHPLTVQSLSFTTQWLPGCNIVQCMEYSHKSYVLVLACGTFHCTQNHPVCTLTLYNLL